MPSSIAKVYGAQLDEKRMEELALYVRPMKDNVVVAPAEDPSEIPMGNGKGLIIPEAARNPNPTEGVVISTGPDVPLVQKLDKDGNPEEKDGQPVTEPQYLAGDRVVFSRYTGMKLTFGDGATLLLVPACDIQGIMDPDCPVLGRDKVPNFIPR